MGRPGPGSPVVGRQVPVDLLALDPSLRKPGRGEHGVAPRLEL
jgi:hypothetical protein